MCGCEEKAVQERTGGAGLKHKGDQGGGRGMEMNK